MNFRVRNPAFGPDVTGTGSQERKRFWHKRELGISGVCRVVGCQGGLTRQGFYQSHSSSTKCSQCTKVKENNLGKDISMLVCILNMLAMLIVAFGF